MFNIAMRNLKIFLRNKTAVFFSFLSVIIIIGLYVLFLGETISSGSDLPGIRQLSDSWIMAGVVGVCTVTASLGAFEIMVSDNESGRLKDFYTAPVTRRTLVGGYIISSAIIGFLLSLFTLIFAQIYMVAYGGKPLDFLQLLKTLGVIALSVMSSGSMIFFIVSFVKNSAAFGSVSIITGTLIGFVTGTYMPISMFPAAIGWVIKILPASHSVVLLRRIFMAQPLAFSFDGGAAEAAYRQAMGADFTVGSRIISDGMHIAYLILTGALFFALAVIRYSKKNKQGR